MKICGLRCGHVHMCTPDLGATLGKQDPRDGANRPGARPTLGVDVRKRIPPLKPLTHRVTLAHLRAVGFWELVDVGTPDECWYMKGRTHDRRGLVYLPSRITGIGAGIHYTASRASKSLHRGRLVPSHLVVDHLCVNPPCVNPHHLDVVTQRTNLKRAGVLA